MRLRLLFLVSFLVVHSFAVDTSSSDSTTPSVDISTTPSNAETSAPPSTSGDATPKETTTKDPNASTVPQPSPGGSPSPGAPTSNPGGPTVSPGAPTPSKGPAAPTTEPPTTAPPPPTTTEFPLLNFGYTCDHSASTICTYSMDVPGLNMALYRQINTSLSNDQGSIKAIGSTEIPGLEATAKVVAKDINDTIADITSKIANVATQLTNLQLKIQNISAASSNLKENYALAEYYIRTVDRNTCYSRKCINPVTTPAPTVPPTTTTTTAPNPCTPNTCNGHGTCSPRFGVAVCSCEGNLDPYNFCTQSNCTAVNDPDEPVVVKDGHPAIIISPGVNITVNETMGSTVCPDIATWYLTTNNTATVFLMDALAADLPFGSLDDAATLQIQVKTNKLKITKKTKASMANLILAKGNTVMISYTNPGGKGSFEFYLKTNGTVPSSSPKTFEFDFSQ